MVRADKGFVLRSLSAWFLCAGLGGHAGALEAAQSQPDRSLEISRAAEALRSSLVITRRDFHMHPELANREERTASVVAQRLGQLGFDEIRTNVAVHGVVGLLKGALPGPVVALRAT